jgi:hypothetical protein
MSPRALHRIFRSSKASVLVGGLDHRAVGLVTHHVECLKRRTHRRMVLPMALFYPRQMPRTPMLPRKQRRARSHQLVWYNLEGRFGKTSLTSVGPR